MPEKNISHQQMTEYIFPTNAGQDHSAESLYQLCRADQAYRLSEATLIKEARQAIYYNGDVRAQRVSHLGSLLLAASSDYSHLVNTQPDTNAKVDVAAGLLVSSHQQLVEEFKRSKPRYHYPDPLQLNRLRYVTFNAVSSDVADYQLQHAYYDLAKPVLDVFVDSEVKDFATASLDQSLAEIEQANKRP